MVESSQYEALHRAQADYGSSAGGSHLAFLLAAVAATAAKNLIDFGCGKGGVVRRGEDLGLSIAGYDPNVAEFARLPKNRFDLLFSFDVLEHIPLDAMDEALSTCAQLSNVAMLVPHLGLANTILPNGENAHCTILTPDEWVKVLSRHYPYVTAVDHYSTNHVVLVASELPQAHIVAACVAVHETMQQLSSPTGVLSRLRSARRLLLSREMLDAIGRKLQKLFAVRERRRRA